jgi:type VI secretion system protein ImpG
MSEVLYRYYERELLFIRQLAQEFARQYPAAAARLRLEPNRSADPHVERLIEAFALLAGRIHHKLDDEFPELTDALLSVLYPHYLAPIPSMGVIQFELDAGRGEFADGFRIERHSGLHTPPVKGVPCQFRTSYPVTLWPVEVAEARLVPPPFSAVLRPPPRAAAALRLTLECQSDLRFADLSLDRLRFYLSGEGPVVAGLYELLFNHTVQVVFRPLGADAGLAPLVLPPAECLGQVGFENEEGLLPYPPQAFVGYRLLTEFFAFPSKFWFVDLGGWDRVRRAGFPGRVEVVMFLNQGQASLEQAIDAGTFRLGCTPVVNLFEKTAEPIPLTHARHEYRIVPDVAHPEGYEVYAVDSVTSADPTTTIEYQPFYSFRHGRAPEDQQTFWYASRRPVTGGEKERGTERGATGEKDRGTDVYLSLVDLGFDPRLPAESVLVVRTTCTNRDLPVRLHQGGQGLHFELETAAPLSGIRCLRSPTAPLRPPLRRGGHWRLISHLCLNHLSLTESKEGREALQEILRLYDFSDSALDQQQASVNRLMVEGITAMRSRRVVGRTGAEVSGGFARGVEVTVELDEEKYVGTGTFLFASVLERFLGLYASVNSFSQLVARTRQGELKKWRPRTGDRQLL